MAQQHTDKRVIVYPTYLDATVTNAEGRTISKEHACDSPDIMEMKEACDKLGLQAIMEDKQYPRTWWVRGRLRVSLRNPDGTPVLPDIPNKRVLVQKIAAQIKAKPNRKPTTFMSMIVQTTQAGQGHAVDSSSANSAAGAKASTGGNKKKKGRK